MPGRPSVVVVMGVAGAGKTTLGRALAARLGVAFHDADDHHPPANREKLARDEPLDDGDRLPWIRALAALLAGAEDGAVLACSALRREHRGMLAGAAPGLVLVHLDVTREQAAARLRARAGAHPLVGAHERILAGQFRDLEEPDEAVRVPGGLGPEEACAFVLEALQKQGRS